MKNDLQASSMSSRYIMMLLLTSIGSRGGHTSLGAMFKEIDFQINEFPAPILSKTRKMSGWALM